MLIAESSSDFSVHYLIPAGTGHQIIKEHNTVIVTAPHVKLNLVCPKALSQTRTVQGCIPTAACPNAFGL